MDWKDEKDVEKHPFHPSNPLHPISKMAIIVPPSTIQISFYPYNEPLDHNRIP
jgi:hypothetical protein